jgi:hypothetical protein
MKAKDAITTTDFKAFYERNEPDNAGELACLYRSVRDVSDETLFETKRSRIGATLRTMSPRHPATC